MLIFLFLKFLYRDKIEVRKLLNILINTYVKNLSWGTQYNHHSCCAAKPVC